MMAAHLRMHKLSASQLNNKVTKTMGLHQLYLFGAVLQLNGMGYHITKMN